MKKNKKKEETQNNLIPYLQRMIEKRKKQYAQHQCLELSDTFQEPDQKILINETELALLNKILKKAKTS